MSVSYVDTGSHTETIISKIRDECSCDAVAGVFAESFKNAHMFAVLGYHDIAYEYLVLAIHALNRLLERSHIPYAPQAIKDSSEKIGEILAEYYPVEFIADVVSSCRNDMFEETSCSTDTLVILHSINKYINKLTQTILNNMEG